MKKLNILFTAILLTLSMLSLSATEIITKDVTDPQGRTNTIWRPLASRILFDSNTVAITVDGYRDLAAYEEKKSSCRHIITVTLGDAAVQLAWTLNQLITNDDSFLKGGVVSDQPE